MSNLPFIGRFFRPNVYTEIPDGGYGWIISFACFMTYAQCVGIQYTIGIFYRSLLSAAQSSGAESDAFLAVDGARSWMAWAVSFESALFLAGAFPTSFIVARVGVRATCLVGACTLCGGFLLASMSTSLPALVLSFAVIGLGAAIPSSAGIVAVVRYFSKRRATATGLAVAGSGVGGLSLGPIVEACVSAYGWRGAMRVLAAMSITILPTVALLFVPILIQAGPSPALDPNHSAPPGRGGEPSDVPQKGGALPHLALLGSGTAAGADVDAWVTEHVPRLIPARDQQLCLPAPTPTPGPGPASSTAGEGGKAALHMAQYARTDELAQAGLPSSSGHEVVHLSEAGPHLPAEVVGASLVRRAPTFRQKQHSARELLGRRPYLLWLAFVAAYGCSWFVCLSHLVQFFGESDARLSPSQAAALVSVQGFTNMAGRVGLGLLADWLTGRVSKVTLLALCVAGVGAATAGLAVPSLGGSYAYQAFYMGMNGALGGSIVSLQAPITVDLVGLPSLPLAQGLFSAVQAPFVLAGPPIAGAVRQASGTYSMVWAGTGVLMLASAAVCALIEPTLAKERQRAEEVLQADVKGHGSAGLGSVLPSSGSSSVSAAPSSQGS